jgi:hypothetical protein
MPPKNKTRKAKPGPKGFMPTNADKDLVTLAVAIGMTREEIAAAIEMPLRSLCRTFRHELKVGRSQRLLANAVRLDRAAEEGNVAAMKALQVMMSTETPEPAEDNHWDKIAADIAAGSDSPNLAHFNDFPEKVN